MGLLCLVRPCDVLCKLLGNVCVESLVEYSARGQSQSIQVASIYVAHSFWLASSWLLRVFIAACSLHVHVCPSAYKCIGKERQIQRSGYVQSSKSCCAKLYLGSVVQYALIQDLFLAFVRHFGDASMLVLSCGLWHLGTLARDINVCSFHDSSAKFSGCFQQLQGSSN